MAAAATVLLRTLFLLVVGAVVPATALVRTAAGWAGYWVACG